MSWHVPVEKRLQTQPAFLRTVKAMRHALSRVTSNERDILTIVTRLETLALGGLAQLWLYADDHLGDDNRLILSPDEVDEIVGITNFCQYVPAEWLKIIDVDGKQAVELPGYVEHNGSTSRTRGLAASRQARRRSRLAAESNAGKDESHGKPRDESVTVTKSRTHIRSEHSEHSEQSNEAASPLLSLNGSKKARKRPSRVPIPEDFKLDAELRSYASERLADVDLDALEADYRGKALKSGWVYANWRQAFQDFVRNAMPNSGHFAAGQYPRGVSALAPKAIMR